MTEPVYLKDSYQKELSSKVVSCKKIGKLWEVILERTIFYPRGGVQPSDQGEIDGPSGKVTVKHVRMKDTEVIHECSLEGPLQKGTKVICRINWKLRYLHMRRHSAGHIIHEAVMQIAPQLIPLRADHGRHLFIEYEGTISIDRKYEIEKISNEIIQKNLPFRTEIVTYDELTKRVRHVTGSLPKNKPLRILQIGTFPPIPDGGTQVKNTGEVSQIIITHIENFNSHVRVHYSISDSNPHTCVDTADVLKDEHISVPHFIGELLEIQQTVMEYIQSSSASFFQLHIDCLGPKSEFAHVCKQIQRVSMIERQQAGIAVNQVKQSIEKAIQEKTSQVSKVSHISKESIDTTAPGIHPPSGHLHIVTQAIMEISKIFEHIGFTRIRYPEIEFDYYAFEALNMPQKHPARDEWETFFIDSKQIRVKNSILSKLVLSPHTSSGQVREMEKGILPIRMINIAKCYRRQIDVSHTPMFHQFEGMYIDRNVSIAHLKGFIDYFVKRFFGKERKFRLRPFHFQFTEPSFEVDISCGICNGNIRLPNGQLCKFCKEGWLELAGSGMIHPNVLQYGGVNPDIYSGFAIGWGVERCFMMKSGTHLDDIRLLYSNDIRFLEQF